MSLTEGRSSIELSAGRVESLWIPASVKSGTTFVLLHEGLGCVSMWRDFPKQLSESCNANIFAWSRYGYGLSAECEIPRPLDYMEKEACQVLPELLSHVPGESIILLGHSDGASIAAIYAGANDDSRLSGIVLIAPHFFTEELSLKAIQQARIAWDTQDLRSRLQLYHGENVDMAFLGWADAWLNPEYHAWDIRHFLPNIKVPAVIIQGTLDQYGTFKQISVARELIDSDFNHALIDDCKHSPHLESPELVLEIVNDFVKRS